MSETENLFFKLIKSILYKKSKLSLEELEELGNISPYVLNNWISSHSPELLVFINETSNKNIELFRNSKNLYNYYYHVIPKVPYKKLKYPKPKKDKKEEYTEEDNEIITFLAKHLELSKKEIKYLIEKQAIQLENFKN